MYKRIFSFFLLVSLVDSYRILGIFPSLDRSNYLVYEKYFRELANKGNQVILIGNYPMVDAPSTYKDIILTQTPLKKGLSFESVINSDTIRIPFETLVSTKVGNDECKTLMNNEQVKELVFSRAKFDVIVVESVNSDCGLALAHNLSAPYISFIPQSLQTWQYSRLGIAFNPSYVTHSGLAHGKYPWFFDRVKGLILYHVTNWVYYIASQVTDHVLLYQFLGNDLPSMESIASNTSLVLLNTHQTVFGGITRPDNIVDIGGIHIRTPRVIPTEIERFINEAEHGVIYVSFGSTVKESTFPKEKLQHILSYFDNLPLRVLWKWDRDIDAARRNVMIKQWMPQYDILRHSNIRLFISHCGILSATEAVDAGVPVICVPLFGDQFGNAAALTDVGLATIVPYEELTKERLLDATNQVLEPRWQQNSKRLSRMWHDRPMSPLETAIYWTEFVARYGGAPNLAATSVGVPSYQYYQLDVYAFLGTVTYVLLFVMFKIFSAICCCSFKKEENDFVQIRERKNNKSVKFE